MPSQKVFRLNGNRELQCLQEEIPSIDKHEVLIRVRAVALNYRDIAIVRFKYPFPVKDNLVPCSDAAGEIVEVGSSVTKALAKGDTVIGTFDPTNLYGPQQTMTHSLGGPVDGVLRQYIVLPAEAVVKVPTTSSLSLAQWASLVGPGLTAWNALYGNSALKPGQTVLFQGRQAAFVERKYSVFRTID